MHISSAHPRLILAVHQFFIKVQTDWVLFARDDRIENCSKKSCFFSLIHNKLVFRKEEVQSSKNLPQALHSFPLFFYRAFLTAGFVSSSYLVLELYQSAYGMANDGSVMMANANQSR